MWSAFWANWPTFSLSLQHLFVSSCILFPNWQSASLVVEAHGAEKGVRLLVLLHTQVQLYSRGSSFGSSYLSALDQSTECACIEEYSPWEPNVLSKHSKVEQTWSACSRVYIKSSSSIKDGSLQSIHGCCPEVWGLGDLFPPCIFIDLWIVTSNVLVWIKFLCEIKHLNNLL